jgi:hypothetical protein
MISNTIRHLWDTSLGDGGGVSQIPSRCQSGTWDTPLTSLEADGAWLVATRRTWHATYGVNQERRGRA